MKAKETSHRRRESQNRKPDPGLSKPKTNARARHQSKDPLWTRLYHFYSLNVDWFEKRYHKRSNVESTFSMIKRKFDSQLPSRVKTAQVNEALCKVLCHNLCVIIHCIYGMGIKPEFWCDEEAPATMDSRETD